MDLLSGLVGRQVSQDAPDQARTAADAVDRASERKATFTRKDVVVAVCSLLQAAAGDPHEVPGWVEQCAVTALENPDQVIALPADRNAERRWVTGRQLMLEARILTTVASGAMPGRPWLDRAMVEARLGASGDSGLELTEGQRAAVRQLSLGSRYGFLVAPAGAGRTTAMCAVVDLHARAGFHVVGLAPSARAARVLADETGAPAETLARYLRDDCRRLDDRTSVLVDEAGMVGSYDWGRLIDAVEATGARLRAIGDPRQLTAPGQPGDLSTCSSEPCRTPLPSVTRCFDSSNRGSASVSEAAPGDDSGRHRSCAELSTRVMGE